MFFLPTAPSVKMNFMKSSGASSVRPRRFVAYASGSCSIAVLRQIIALLPMYFYCPPKGGGTAYLTPLLFGAALTIARVADIVSDPLVGYFSDRTRHRWGRRLPWIVFGAPLWLTATILIFLPPGGENYPINYLWLIGAAVLFFIGMTAVQIPYTALLPEITRSPAETMNVSARMGRFYILGVGLAVGWGLPLMDEYGVVPTVVILSMISAVPLFFAVREIARTPQAPTVATEPGLVRNAWSVLRQKPFYLYLCGHGLFILGYYMMLVSLLYFVTEILVLPKMAAPFFLLLTMGVSFLTTPLTERLCLKFGKKAVMLGAMLLFAFAFGLWYFVGRMPGIDYAFSLGDATGWTGAWAAQASLYKLLESLAVFVIFGAALSVQMTVPNAIVADLVLYDEKITGRKREALVFGVQGGLEKNAVTLATYLTGICLACGRSAEAPDGIYYVGPVAAAASFLGCLIFWFYPLGKNGAPAAHG